MNLDELQSVQARERQSSDLQHLRSSFYREVGEFINDLNEERARVVEAAEDPFSEPEVRQLSNDIETAESTVEAIYERRVGKVVKKASIAAAGMPVEDDGLTDEERALFDDLVDRIERNRETVLSVLDGNAPSVSCSIDEAEDRAGEDAATSAAPSPEVAAGSGSDPGSGSDSDPGPGSDSDADPNPQPPDGVSAADLMGGSADAGNGAGSDAEAGAETRAADPSPEPPATEAPPSEAERETTPAPNGTAAASAAEDESPSSSTTDPDASQIPGVPRTTVRITADVGEIVGADDRDYDLGTEDVVTLPEPNADVLVEKDAAERL